MVTIIWSTTFPIGKAAFEHLTPSLLTASRFALSALLLAPRLMGLRASELRLGAALGVLQFICVAFVFHGMATTPAGRSAFLVSLSVFMVPLGNWMLRRPVSWQQGAAAIVACFGVGLLTDVTSGGFSSGDAWITGSALAFAVYMLLIEWAGPQDNPLRLSAFQLVVVAVMAVAWYGLDQPATSAATALGAVWPSVIYLALSAIVTTSLQAWGQRTVSAHDAALVFVLEPVLASLWSYWFLGERLTLLAIPGAILIVGANLWSQWTPPARETIK